MVSFTSSLVVRQTLLDSLERLDRSSFAQARKYSHWPPSIFAGATRVVHGTDTNRLLESWTELIGNDWITLTHVDCTVDSR